MNDQKLIDAFKNAEANCALSGIQVAGHPLHESIKRRLIANLITFEQAREEIKSFYTTPSPEFLNEIFADAKKSDLF